MQVNELKLLITEKCMTNKHTHSKKINALNEMKKRAKKSICTKAFRRFFGMHTIALKYAGKPKTIQ